MCVEGTGVGEKFMDHLRTLGGKLGEPGTELGVLDVKNCTDYLPESNVLLYELNGLDWIAFRPPEQNQSSRFTLVSTVQSQQRRAGWREFRKLLLLKLINIRKIKMTDEVRIALLIDAENISAQYAGYIIDEIEKYGICSYKRIYGNWERIVKTRWEQEIRKHSLKPMMQVNNTRGKNASDSALIIDAMDILYGNNVEASA